MRAEVQYIVHVLGCKKARPFEGSGHSESIRFLDYFFRLLALTIVLSFVLPESVLAQNQGSEQKVLILFDGPTTGYGEGLISAYSVANLLGHFSLKFDIKPVKDYSKGLINQYGWIFFAEELERTLLPKDFLEDVARSPKRIVWINRQLNQLTADAQFRNKIGFSYLDYYDNGGFDAVIYDGITLRKTDPDLNLIRIENRFRCRIWAQARNDEGLFPYIVQSDNFWYVADSPFSFVEEGDRYLVFCDLLHEILGIPHPRERHALVRIEDVSIDDDPIELRRVADYLSSQDVPFQIGLIPIFKDPAKGIELYLSDRPQFVETLKYMIARGGSVVLHGVTHQFRSTSGDDFEFWDDLKDRSLSFESANWIRERIELGIQECFKNGIYPIAWETPHYGASRVGFQVFKEFFSHVNERRMVLEQLGTQQYFPYPLTDMWGQKVIPENLGYVSIEDPNPHRLVEDAQKMLAVRDGMPSFFFHSFVKLEHLKTIVTGIERSGYQFVSLKSFGPQVFTSRKAVTATSGTVRLNLEDEYLRTADYDAAGKIVSETISESPLSGETEAKVKVQAGHLAVIEAVQNKPDRKGAGWYEVWKREMAAFLPWTTDKLPEQKLVDEVSLLWVQNPGSIVQTENLRSQQQMEDSVSEINDQESFRSVLKVFGIRTRLIPGDRLEPELELRPQIIIVPYASGKNLAIPAQELLLKYVQRGGMLLLDGETELSRKLGIRFAGRQLPISRLHDLSFPDVSIEWKPAGSFPRFTPPRGARILYVDPESQAPVGIQSQVGAGKIVFLAPLFDPHSKLGISRFPYLMNFLRSDFNLRSLARRPQIEIYFDPGMRTGVSLESLVRSWNYSGVKIVYAAAWATGYRNWDFNYSYFIDLCHKNGILVYAWFELPQVSEKFWDAHPEWREKTASGQDSHTSWRLSMNLYNPQCRRQAFEVVSNTMNRFRWDGVNFAELNFDTDHGPLNPAKYIPLNEDVRRDFAVREGFDPLKLFDPQTPYFWQKNPKALARFEEFRSDIVKSWHREVLELMTPLCQQKGWELVITMLDSLHSLTLQRDTGLNSNQILELMNGYPFTLQVEDPAEFWTKSPDRYGTFVETYIKRVPDRRRLMFDLNIIPNRMVENSPLPTSTQTGMEFGQMLYHAAKASGRVAVYAESTLAVQDFEIMDAVLAADTEVVQRPDTFLVSAPYTVLVRVDPQKSYRLDDQDWPFREGGQILVPPGKHEITQEKGEWNLLEWTRFNLTLKNIQAELLGGERTKHGMRFRYEGRTRTIAQINREPYQIILDGQKVSSNTIYFQGQWIIFLPPGEHVAEFQANTAASLILHIASLLSSYSIVIVGLGSGVALILLYGAILIKRFLHRGLPKTVQLPNKTIIIAKEIK
jgi:uncharacterized protein YdaL